MQASNPSRVIFFVTTLGALAALGCGSASVGGGTPSNQTVTVAVDPSTATLTTSQSTQFAAAVTGTIDTTVTWTIDEASGGSVATNGTYTAPGTAGTFHVRATSHADSRVSASATVTVNAPPPAGSVAISPKSTTLLTGGTATFTATVTNLTGGVTYAVQETSGCGSVTSGGVYTAPTTARTCHVVATSTADTTKSDVATVTVNAPVAVTLSASTAAVDACKTVTFTATVTGSTNTGVTWSITEGAAGGTIANGLYTAPSTGGTYHVVATSAADGTKTATATVTVTERIVSVAVNPTTASLTTGGTQQFSATVTTTCGTFTATGG
jgi:hypothetical protein